MPEKINASEAHILPGKAVFTGLSGFICARAGGATRATDIMSAISTGRIKVETNSVASNECLNKRLVSPW